VRRFESCWGRFLLPGQMVADLGIRRIALSIDVQPDVARSCAESEFPEHVRNEITGSFSQAEDQSHTQKPRPCLVVYQVLVEPISPDFAKTCKKTRPARQIQSVNAIYGTAPAADLPPPGRPHRVAALPTRELLDVVVNSEYTGYPWEELARRLVARALPDLEQAIRTGAIYQRCRRARLGIRHWPDLQRLPLAQHVAAEAVEDCLERFRAEVIPAGEWDPDRGASLEDFFAMCCLPHVANRWRWHLRQYPPNAVQLDALDEPGQAGVLALAVEAPTDPAVIVELRDDLTRALAFTSADNRAALVLKEQGWSSAEIA
jgi:hypothetical protein